MANTSYKLFPKTFESLVEDRTTELGVYMSMSIRTHALLPPFPLARESVTVLTTPDYLVVTTDDIATFTWEDVQLPIAFVTELNYDQQQKIYEQNVLFRDVATGKEFSFIVDVREHDLKDPSASTGGLKNVSIGSSYTYNIFYFFAQLPHYSATYDLQVRIADVVSNTHRIDIQLYENDTLIIPPTKELP